MQRMEGEESKTKYNSSEYLLVLPIMDLTLTRRIQRGNTRK